LINYYVKKLKDCCFSEVGGKPLKGIGSHLLLSYTRIKKIKSFVWMAELTIVLNGAFSPRSIIASCTTYG